MQSDGIYIISTCHDVRFFKENPTISFDEKYRFSPPRLLAAQDIVNLAVTSIWGDFYFKERKNNAL